MNEHQMHIDIQRLFQSEFQFEQTLYLMELRLQSTVARVEVLEEKVNKLTKQGG
ncbi:hypothetical protein [Vibrio breoganii]|uniref:hypothetical protein n=1 Tax=Vibrio breoganii TaxID=553239 RepID=UPI0013000597|nr:hypothetical protein [Vibrio breoganii]